jgi:hypothetical protein
MGQLGPSKHGLLKKAADLNNLNVPDDRDVFLLCAFPLCRGYGLMQLLNCIAGGVSAQHHYTYSELQNSTELKGFLNSFLNSQSYNNSLLKAFVNWILLDERFNYVSSSSGFEQVGDMEAYTTHTRTDLPVNKSGYLYVYVSNETPNIDSLSR